MASFIPFVPNYKYDIQGLETCWKYVGKNLDCIEPDYFSELAIRTMELFLEYNAGETVGKEIVILIGTLGQVAFAGEYKKYSTPDIIKAVTLYLLQCLEKGFSLTYDSVDILILYDDAFYPLEAKTMDISRIQNKENAKL